jgi:hypothetical protein
VNYKKKPLTKAEKNALITELQARENQRQEEELQNNLYNSAEESQWQVSDQDENTLILDGWTGTNLNLNDQESTRVGNLVKTTVNWGLDEQGKPIITEDLIRKTDEVGANYRKFSGKRLIFRNCKKLKKIEADCLGLTGIRFEEDCSQLEYLSAYNNEIKILNLVDLEKLKLARISDNKLIAVGVEGCTNLEDLDVRNNKLKELNLDDNTKLIKLNCSQNEIEELKVKDLEQLEFLHCYFNHLLELDCSNLKNLKDLNCHNNIADVIGIGVVGLNKLILKNCESLKKLDVAENRLTALSLWNLHNLKAVSLKENSLKQLTIKNTPNLEFLDFSRQGLFKLNIETKGFTLEKSIPVNFGVWENAGQNLKKLFYTEGAKFWKIASKDNKLEISKEDILKYLPKLKKFEASFGETFDFERYLDKLKKEEKRKKRERAKKKKKKKKNQQSDSAYASDNEEEEIITDPAQLTRNDHEYLLDEFANEPEITIAGEDLMGIMIIDGYQGRKINVGDNYLSYLAVRNCPNLTTLRYAHNALKHDAWYDKNLFNNPKLTIIDNNNWDGGIIWDQASRTQFDQGELKPKITFDKKEESTEAEETLKQILRLIYQAEEALAQGDLKELASLLEQIKEMAQQPIEGISQEKLQAKINDLESRLNTATNQINQSKPMNIALLTLVIVILIWSWKTYLTKILYYENK